jgi:hypothetical protein
MSATLVLDFRRTFSEYRDYSGRRCQPKERTSALRCVAARQEIRATRHAGGAGIVTPSERIAL